MSHIGLPEDIKTKDDAYVQGIADGRKQMFAEVIDKLIEAGWDNPDLRKLYNDSPVSWLEAEMDETF